MSPQHYAVIVLLACASTIIAAEPGPVTVSDDPEGITLANGIVSARLAKATARLTSLRYRDLEFISSGQGYMNCYGNSSDGIKTEKKPGTPTTRLTQDPAQNGGAIAEVAVRFPATGEPGTVPFTIEVRYTLRRGDPGVYAWCLLDHAAGSPNFDIEAGTFVYKLNPQIFDFFTADARRRMQMTRGEDWIAGEKLNLKEARRLTTGPRKGEVEHKYDFAALYGETPTYGWSSTAHRVGLWMINSNLEFMSGGPLRVDLTGHLDGKPALPADPTLLLVWHSLHYGGQLIQVGRDESWSKVIGPVLLYCNGERDHEALWRDACARAEQERAAWPYAWAQAPGYTPAAERGQITGLIKVRDPQAPAATAANAWVGVAASPYPALIDAKIPGIIDWQTDGKYYQHWTRADANGRFTIPTVRPGTYTLTTVADGVFGEFSQAAVTVQAGETLDLGTLNWSPARFGTQLWDIGIPNRSAEEFRHGDHYWQWGLYQLYPTEFPNDVDFMIGKSDYRTDWNYVQPAVPDGNGKWKGTTWRIRFPFTGPSSGTATLRLGICGARGGSITLSVNGTTVGGTGPLPQNSVMHRDGIRAVLYERNSRFDAKLLRSGDNVIELARGSVRDWTDGILYDYVRLEVDPSVSPASP